MTTCVDSIIDLLAFYERRGKGHAPGAYEALYIDLPIADLLEAFANPKLKKVTPEAAYRALTILNSTTTRPLWIDAAVYENIKRCEARTLLDSIPEEISALPQDDIISLLETLYA